MLQGLENSGLIKQTGAGQYEGVDSYAEHQQLAAQKHAESQARLQESQSDQVL